MDPQPHIIERAIMRCIDISVRLGALEDEVPPAAGRDHVTPPRSPPPIPPAPPGSGYR